MIRPSSPEPDVEPATAGKRNPKWADPELILALDLYLRRGIVDDKDQEVVELSELLNRLPIHAARPDAVHFRNANDVALKLANFAAFDPSYEGKGMSRGGRRDAQHAAAQTQTRRCRGHGQSAITSSAD